MSQNNWRLRRRTVKLSLMGTFILLAYLLVWGQGESSLHSTLASALMIQVSLLIGGYVFGAASDMHVNGEDPDSGVGKDTKLGSWENRRAEIIKALFLCAAAVVYLTFWGTDTSLNESFATGACLLFSGIVNAWIFGGVYDDYAVKSRLGG